MVLYWVGSNLFKVQDMIETYDREAKGIPIGRAPAVNLRNNHSQYIITW